MLKWFRARLEKSKADAAYYWWDTEAGRLMKLCHDTGGENSPYLYKLREHMSKIPTKG